MVELGESKYTIQQRSQELERMLNGIAKDVCDVTEQVKCLLGYIPQRRNNMNEEEIHKILDILKRESEESVKKWVLVNYGSSKELDIEMDRLLDHLTEVGKRDFVDWVKSECGVEWSENLSIKDKRRVVKKAMETENG